MADPTALFTVSDARAFDKAQLANATTYPDAVITAAEARIRASFALICGVSFIPVSDTLTLDGIYSSTIRVPVHNPYLETPRRPLTISAAKIDGVALTVGELTDLVADADGHVVRKSGDWYGAWPNLANVSITVKHGWAAVPADIKLAAVTLCAYQVVPTNLSDRVTQFSNADASYTVAYAGGAGHWYGIPFVDAVLGLYLENRAVVL